MLRNGSYSAWFRTPKAGGTGIVVLNDGKLTGGDTVLAYTGTYFQNGDRFSASVRTQRHSPGQPSVFGIDNLDLTLIGRSTPTTASCAGTAKQAPDLMLFVATLVPMAD
jgi:T3SS negative regulator,GrlR